MDKLIETINIAVATNATDEARVAGADACRMILMALEGKAGEPLASAAPQPASSTTAQFGAMVSALRGVPPDQLLDLAIAKLRAALPAVATVPQVAPLKFHIIPLSPQVMK